jgi:hypothetical protein
VIFVVVSVGAPTRRVGPQKRHPKVQGYQLREAFAVWLCARNMTIKTPEKERQTDPGSACSLPGRTAHKRAESPF